MQLDNFKKNHFCVIKNYIENEEINKLLKIAETNNLYGGSGPSGPHILYPSDSSVLNTLFRNISKSRLKAIDEKKEEFNLDEYFIQTYSKQRYWSRFMKYNDQEFFPHRDAKEEVMAILFLTQYGKDYSGGLKIINNDLTEINLDSLCNKGDLLIVSGGAFIHYVNVHSGPENIGRITYFVNSHPLDTKGVVSFTEGTLANRILMAKQYLKESIKKSVK